VVHLGRVGSVIRETIDPCLWITSPDRENTLCLKLLRVDRCVHLESY
jgi:hypothetical protein